MNFFTILVKLAYYNLTYNHPKDSYKIYVDNYALSD